MKSRPKRYDINIVTDAAKRLAPEVVEWANGKCTLDEAVKAIVKAAQWTDDAYHMARSLENQGWDPDVELVEILEGLDIHRSFEAAVKEWVKENSIALHLSVGTIVHTVWGTGPIVDLRPETACYCVKCDDGTREPGYIGTIVEAEHVRLVDALETTEARA